MDKPVFTQQITEAAKRFEANNRGGSPTSAPPEIRSGEWMDVLAQRWNDMADYLLEESKKGYDVEHRIAYAEARIYRHCADVLKTNSTSINGLDG